MVNRGELGRVPAALGRRAFVGGLPRPQRRHGAGPGAPPGGARGRPGAHAQRRGRGPGGQGEPRADRVEKRIDSICYRVFFSLRAYTSRVEDVLVKGSVIMTWRQYAIFHT